MPIGRPLNKTLYKTPNLGIEVVSEYPTTKKNPYIRCYIRKNKLINGVYIRKSRLIMTDHLKRKLMDNEYVHHLDGNKLNDTIENLELISPQEHNKHHKNGSKHTEDTKRKISESLTKAYFIGKRPVITYVINRDTKGRIL